MIAEGQEQQFGGADLDDVVALQGRLAADGATVEHGEVAAAATLDEEFVGVVVVDNNSMGFVADGVVALRAEIEADFQVGIAADSVFTLYQPEIGAAPLTFGDNQPADHGEFAHAFGAGFGIGLVAYTEDMGF